MKSPKIPSDIDWATMLRNADVVDLGAVRQMQEGHRRLFQFAGPPAIGSFVRVFRLIGLFGFFAMSEKRFPILNRAWADLAWIGRNPEADEYSVQSWLYLDLPVTDDGRTLAEVFLADIAPDDANLRAFVEVARKSRYGLYVDDGGTATTHRVVEMITGRPVSVSRGVNALRGEVFWTRIIDWQGMTFMLGDTRGWPPSHRGDIEDMLIDRVCDSRWMNDGTSPTEAYEPFMKLSGPYWLSMLYARSDADPILEPDRYLDYSRGPVPALSPQQWARP